MVAKNLRSGWVATPFNSEITWRLKVYHFSIQICKRPLIIHGGSDRPRGLDFKSFTSLHRKFKVIDFPRIQDLKTTKTRRLDIKRRLTLSST
jgi:hypothetical protein